MRISIRWLNEFVDVLDLDPRSLAEKLTLSTAEIEGVEIQGGELHGVVAARLVSAHEVSGSDHLRVVEVDAGTVRGAVVCGAPNVRPGAIGALAPPGSRLKGGREIERQRIAGLTSDGMLCSALELGLGTDGSGLLYLPDDTPPGAPVADIEGVRDAILEIDNKAITHRPDLWGHYGFAREIAALYGRALKPLGAGLARPPARGIEVTIESPAHCPRYVALTIRGVRVGESPFWLRRRLDGVGLRPISNLVDLTNHVMLETGQPMHAFDLAKLEGPEIRVRLARRGERLRTLDGADRALPADSLVIADRSRPAAIAGVMGGAASEVTSGTKDVLLESANFDPVSVRRTSVRLGLRTEAVARFEKSLDPELASAAVLRFLETMSAIGAAPARADEITDAYVKKAPGRAIRLDVARLGRRLGVAVGRPRAQAILERLSFGAVPDGEDLVVSVPSFRSTKDVTIEDDLVEEVGRIHGYGAIAPEPPVFRCTPGPRDPLREIERPIRASLSGSQRFTEVATYSFAVDEHLQRLGLLGLPYVRLAHPTQQNMSRLRRDLVPALLSLVEPNARNFPTFRFYELGRTYWPERAGEDGLPFERRHVAGVIVPERRRKQSGLAFATALDAALSVLGDLLVSSADVSPLDDGARRERPWIHPTRAASLTAKGRVLGYVAELHPKAARAFDVRSDAALFDLEIDEVVAAPRRALKYVAPPKYPAIKRDVSVNVPRARAARDVESAIRAVDPAVIGDVELIEVFTGGPIPPDMKNLAYHIDYRSPDRTLRSEEADAVHARVVEALRSLGGVVRGREVGGD